jgi:hypothetical protein
MNRSRFAVCGAAVAGIALLVAAVIAATPGSVAQSPGGADLTHPNIVAPASLSGDRAEAVYQAIRDQIRSNYAAYGDPDLMGYQSWKRYNKTPYRSNNHGERFVNHYGNDKAAGYGKFEDLDPLPEGAIVIKDSFSVTQTGAVMTGPLFMMEKMAPDFSSGDDDWRYLMLRPDGTLVGMTGGADSDRMKFCAECHKRAGPEQDFLFFMPDESRIPATR